MKKNKKVGISKIALLILYIVVAFAFGYIIGKAICDIQKMNGGYAVVIVLLLLLIEIYISNLLAAITHESGHLLFGKLTGYHFSSFRIGSLMLVKNQGKYFFKRLNIIGMGGQCLMDPPTLQNGKIPFALYNLGGVILNVVCGGAFLGFYIIWREVDYLSTFLILMSIMNLAYAVINGIPLKLDMVTNDGYNTHMIAKSFQAKYAFWVQLRINTLNIQGVRLKDMPAEWFFVPNVEEMKNVMVAPIALLGYNRLMDQHKFFEASKEIQKIKDSGHDLAGIHLQLLICDEIFCALIEDDAKEINKLLDDKQKLFMKNMAKFPAVMRTNYACALLCENDELKAGKIRENFERIVKTYPYISDIESEEEFMNLAHDKWKINNL